MAPVEQTTAPIRRGERVPTELDEAQETQPRHRRHLDAPEQVGDLVEVPHVELVVQRPSENQADKV